MTDYYCDKCKIKLEPTGLSHTLMGWFDPTELEGHRHDPNRYTKMYVCPICDWSQFGENVLGPPCPKTLIGECTWEPPTHWLNPTRTEIKVIPPDNNKELKLGWKIKEIT